MTSEQQAGIETIMEMLSPIAASLESIHEDVEADASPSHAAVATCVELMDDLQSHLARLL